MIEKLQAARLKATKIAPYLASAIYKLKMVQTSDMLTMAVDKGYRCYYNNGFVEQSSVAKLAMVLAHECWHVLRGHFKRAEPYHGEKFSPELWNVAADVVVNENLIVDGFDVLDGITADSVDVDTQCTVEEVYTTLIRRVQNIGGGSGEPNSSESSQTNDTADSSGESSSPNSSNDSAHDDQSDNADGSGGFTCESAESDSAEGDDSSSSGSDESISSGSLQNDDDSPSVERNKDIDNDKVGDETDDNNSVSGSPDDDSKSDNVNCDDDGSPAADGLHRDYQLPEDDDEAPAVSDLERKNIEMHVAEAIEQCGKASLAARRWAEQIRAKRVPWERLFRSYLRGAVARRGDGDTTYSRFARRQPAYKNVIIPDEQIVEPNVCVIIDSSGSMSDSMLGRGIDIVDQFFRTFSSSVQVIVCDSSVHVKDKINSAKKLHIVGGGGTSMTEGINAAMQLKPTPDVITVVTDGHTPWPTKKVDSDVIVLLVGSGDAPSWAKTVRV